MSKELDCLYCTSMPNSFFSSAGEFLQSLADINAWHGSDDL